MTTMRFDLEEIAFHSPTIRLAGLRPLVNGELIAAGDPAVSATEEGWRLAWELNGPATGAGFVLELKACELPGGGEGLEIGCHLTGIQTGTVIDSFGLRIEAIDNVRAYLRSGYFSWDGSFYVEPQQLGVAGADPKLATGYALSQLLPESGEGSVVIGFLRHDRFQHRFRFEPQGASLAVAIETLWDRIPHDGPLQSEPLVIFAHAGAEEALRVWARLVAAASPHPPRVSEKRITGWCSWYNLYAAITEENILEHLEAARGARDGGLRLRVFQIDDGFTPEMGDWLDVKPQFPRGMKALLADIEAAGFVPGLWIAPFLVGNRSRLFREHPDWVVRDRDGGGPLAYMTFYGEFRWHKRSEEYYVLDVTHPEAEAYIRDVFRTWRHDWGCRYFKTDFMNAGSDYGPDRAVWREAGLTRIEVWMRMARLIREEIGDALWLGCGSPLFVPVGLVDAVRIGRDIGVKWAGADRSAQSLLRDQTTRNFANGILWQSDPDCVLLRDRFHHLTEAQVESLALFAGLAGGVLMTSDHLGEISPNRRPLLALLLGDGVAGNCDFPFLGDASASEAGAADPLILQQVGQNSGAARGSMVVNAFNTADHAIDRRIPWARLGLSPPSSIRDWRGEPLEIEPTGLRLQLGPHESACLILENGSFSGVEKAPA